MNELVNKVVQPAKEGDQQAPKTVGGNEAGHRDANKGAPQAQEVPAA